jgi:hypothetical protein
MTQKSFYVLLILAGSIFSGRIFGNTGFPIMGGPDDPIVIPLWENGAHGFEQRRDDTEEAKDYFLIEIL